MGSVVGEVVSVVTHTVAVAVSRFGGVVGECVGVVTHAIVVVVAGFATVVREGIGVVAGAVTVAVGPFRGVVGEGIGVVSACVVTVSVVVGVGGLRGVVVKRIGVVAHAVVVRIRGFVGVVREGIGVVTGAVAVAVDGFGWVVGEGVLAVKHTVVVRVDVDDGDVAGVHHVALKLPIGGHDFGHPQLTHLGVAGGDGLSSIERRVVGAVNVPVDVAARFRVVFRVTEGVGENQVIVHACFWGGRDELVADAGSGVGWRYLWDGDLKVVPSVTTILDTVAVDVDHGDVDGHGP